MKRARWLALVIGSGGVSAQTPAVPVAPRAHDQVTVSASRASSPIGETARTSSTLDAAALHDFPSVTLDEGLRQHAGFELFRRASSRVANPTSEGVSLRGLGSTAASRTLVLEDGAPLNDPFGGWVHWNESPQPTIHALTLVTGGGSDLYGSSALGGVIDVTPETTIPARLQFSGLGGSQSTYDLTGTAAATGRLAGILVAAESLRSGGYRPVDPALAGLVDVAASVLSQTGRVEMGRRELATRRVFLTGNLLNEARDNGTPTQTNGTRLWRYLAGYDLPDTPIVSGRLRAFGSDEGYRQSFSSIAADRNTESLTRLQRVRTQELGATTDATLHLGRLSAIAGADVRDIRGSDNETPFSKSIATAVQGVTARQRFAGAFGELLGTAQGWAGTASLRVDRASNLDTTLSAGTLAAGPTRMALADRNEVVLSPHAGVVRALGPRAEVHASGFRAFRSPSMNELYRTGQVGQETTQANASLLSERATGWEAGGRFTSRGRVPAVGHATYFWTEINRPVSAVFVSQTATSILNQRQNLGQIRSRGVEVSAEVHPLPAIGLTLGYQYADATVTKFAAQTSLVGNRTPAVPRHSFTAQVRTESRRLGELTLATRASGQAFDDAANRYALAGFYTVDLSGRRTLARGLEATFLIQNLTNQRAQVARTPILTLGSPVFAEAGLRFNFGGPRP